MPLFGTGVPPKDEDLQQGSSGNESTSSKFKGGSVNLGTPLDLSPEQPDLPGQQEKPEEQGVTLGVDPSQYATDAPDLQTMMQDYMNPGGNKPTNPMEDPQTFWQWNSVIRAQYELGLTDEDTTLQQSIALGSHWENAGGQFYDKYLNGTCGDLIEYFNKILPKGQELTPEFIYGLYNEYVRNGWKGVQLNSDKQTPSSPSSVDKEHKAAQELAYNVYRLHNAYLNSDLFDKEMKVAVGQILGWVNRTDLNLSDDEIIKRLDIANKFPTLAKIESTYGSAKGGIDLARGTDYTQELLYGYIWAARNGLIDPKTGDIDEKFDSAALMYYYYTGKGKQWQEDPKVTAMLNPNDTQHYNPYGVGTTMNDAALFFGVTSFDQNWLNRNKEKWQGNELYNDVYQAEAFTQACESEYASLKGLIDGWIEKGMKADRIIEKMESELGQKDGPYAHLNELTDSLGKKKDLKNITRKLDWDKNGMMEYIRTSCDKRDGKIEEAQDDLTVVMNMLNGTNPIDTTVQLDDAHAKYLLDLYELCAENEQMDQYAGMVFKTTGATYEQDAASIAEGLASGKLTPDLAYAATTLELALFVDNNKDLLTVFEPCMRYADAKTERDKLIADYEKATGRKFVGTLSDSEASEYFDQNEIIWANMSEKERIEAITKAYAGVTYDEERERLIGVDGKDYTHLIRMADPDEIVSIVAAAKLTEAGSEAVQARYNLIADIYQYDQIMQNNKRGYDAGSKLWEQYQALLQSYSASAEAAIADENSRLTGISDPVTKKPVQDTTAACLSWVLAIGMDYRPTDWQSEDRYHQFIYTETHNEDGSLREGVDMATVRANADKLAAEDIIAYAGCAQNLEYSLAYMESMGVNIPDEYRKNIERKLNDYQTKLEQARYSGYLSKEDFAAVSGKAMTDIGAAFDKKNVKSAADYKAAFQDGVADENGYTPLDYLIGGKVTFLGLYGVGVGGQEAQVNNPYFWTQFMNEDEKNTYLYIRATEGRESAEKYYNSLSGTEASLLQIRYAKETEGSIREAAQESAEGAVGATIFSFGTSFEQPAGAVYSVYQYLTGNEINPYSVFFMPSRLTSASREAVTERWFDDKTLLGYVEKIGYNAFTSAVDSFINYQVFGGLFEGLADAAAGAPTRTIKFWKSAAHGFVTSIPMGTGAGGAAIMNAIQRGATPEQALRIGFATAFSETITEAITTENIHAWMRADLSTDSAKKGFMKWIKGCLSSAGEEFVGEFSNEVMEYAADYLIMGSLNQWNQTVDYYERKFGMSPEQARAATITDVLKQALEAGFTGFLSGFFSTGAGTGVQNAIASVEDVLHPGDPAYGTLSLERQNIDQMFAIAYNQIGYERTLRDRADRAAVRHGQQPGQTNSKIDNLRQYYNQNMQNLTEALTDYTRRSATDNGLSFSDASSAVLVTELRNSWQLYNMLQQNSNVRTDETTGKRLLEAKARYERAADTLHKFVEQNGGLSDEMAETASRFLDGEWLGINPRVTEESSPTVTEENGPAEEETVPPPPESGDVPSFDSNLKPGTKIPSARVTTLEEAANRKANEKDALDQALADGLINDAQYQEQLDALNKKYDAQTETIGVTPGGKTVTGKEALRKALKEELDKAIQDYKAKQRAAGIPIDPKALKAYIRTLRDGEFSFDGALERAMKWEKVPEETRDLPTTGPVQEEATPTETVPGPVDETTQTPTDGTVTPTQDTSENTEGMPGEQEEDTTPKPQTRVGNIPEGTVGITPGGKQCKTPKELARALAREKRQAEHELERARHLYSEETYAEAQKLLDQRYSVEWAMAQVRLQQGYEAQTPTKESTTQTETETKPTAPTEESNPQNAFGATPDGTICMTEEEFNKALEDEYNKKIKEIIQNKSLTDEERTAAEAALIQEYDSFDADAAKKKLNELNQKAEETTPTEEAETGQESTETDTSTNPRVTTKPAPTTTKPAKDGAYGLNHFSYSEEGRMRAENRFRFRQAAPILYADSTAMETDTKQTAQLALNALMMAQYDLQQAAQSGAPADVLSTLQDTVRQTFRAYVKASDFYRNAWQANRDLGPAILKALEEKNGELADAREAVLVTDDLRARMINSMLGFGINPMLFTEEEVGQIRNMTYEDAKRFVEERNEDYRANPDKYIPKNTTENTGEDTGSNAKDNQNPGAETGNAQTGTPPAQGAGINRDAQGWDLSDPTLGQNTGTGTGPEQVEGGKAPAAPENTWNQTGEDTGEGAETDGRRTQPPANPTGEEAPEATGEGTPETTGTIVPTDTEGEKTGEKAPEGPTANQGTGAPADTGEGGEGQGNGQPTGLDINRPEGLGINRTPSNVPGDQTTPPAPEGEGLGINRTTSDTGDQTAPPVNPEGLGINRDQPVAPTDTGEGGDQTGLPVTPDTVPPEQGTPPVEPTQTDDVTPPVDPADVVGSPEWLARVYLMLNGLLNSGAQAQAAGVAGALDPGTGTIPTQMAQAAGSALAGQFGSDTAAVVKGVMGTARSARNAQLAMTIGALTHNTPSNNALKALNTNPSAESVDNLIRAAYQDSKNPDYIKRMAAEVTKFQAARELAKGNVPSELLDKFLNATDEYYNAADQEAQRRREYQDAESAYKNADNHQKSVTAQFGSDPGSSSKLAMLGTAVGDFNAKGELLKQAGMAYSNAIRATKEARAAMRNAGTQAYSSMKAAAQGNVLQRQQAQIQQALEQRMAAIDKAADAVRQQQAARQAAEEMQDNQNIDEADWNEFAREHGYDPNDERARQKYLDKSGKFREAQAQNGEAKAPTKPGQLSEARKGLVERVAKSYGWKVEWVDSLLEGRARGAFDRSSGTIYLSNGMTQDDAMQRVFFHELTHSAEGNGYYNAFRAALIDLALDGNFAQFNKMVNARMEAYNNVLRGLGKKEIDRTQAAAEVTSDLAGPVVFATEQQAIDFANRRPTAVQHIIETIKDFVTKLRGVKASYKARLERAQHLYEKALKAAQEARARRMDQSPHPIGELFALDTFFESTDLIPERDSSGHVVGLMTLNGERVTNITPAMLENSPIGRMTRIAVDLGQYTTEQRDDLLDMMSKLASTVLKTNDVNTVFEFASAMLASPTDVWEWSGDPTFSAMKSNSDPQYTSTIDFGTVCSRTQQLIDVLSKTMIQEGRGLTRDEVLKAYQMVATESMTEEYAREHKMLDANGNPRRLQITCPVCYVFSRWVGVPSLLGTIGKYQSRFLGMTDQELTDYVRGVESGYIDNNGKFDKEAFGRKKTGLKKKIDQTIDTIDKYMAEHRDMDALEQDKKYKSLQNKLDKLQAEYDELNAYSYVTQVVLESARDGNTRYLLTYDRNGKLVENGGADTIFHKDATVKAVPNEILYDMNRGGDFARLYPKTWMFRTTRGAGMGKAVMPFAGWRIGDIIQGANQGGYRVGATRTRYNPVTGETEQIPLTSKTVNELLRNGADYGSDKDLNTKMMAAIARQAAQNLIGGQRLQSTSDFRAEWGLDYVMALIELQAIGGKSQLYTKVLDAVDFLATSGNEVNMSAMSNGLGYRTNPDGTQELVLSSVTGVNPEQARAFQKKYSNAQMILVGLNDTHIRLALQMSDDLNNDIMFVIPWHSSGNSIPVLDMMMKAIGADGTSAHEDFTNYENDDDIQKYVNKVVAGKYKAYKDANKNNKNAMKRAEFYAQAIQDLGFNTVGIEGLGDVPVSRIASMTDDEIKKLKITPTKDQQTLRDLRLKIVKGEFLDTAPTADEMNTIRGNKYLSKLYDRFYVDENSDAYHLHLTGDTAEKIFPYEYWSDGRWKDENGNFIPAANYRDSRINGDNFVEYCHMLGLVPRFNQFSNEDGYWKLLIDRRMFDTDGNYREAGRVNVTEAAVQMLPGSVNEATYGDVAATDRAVEHVRHGRQNADGTVTPSVTEAMNKMLGRDTQTEDNGDALVYSIPVEDQEMLDFLNEQERNGDVTVTYRTMKLLNGKLYSPKATYINGQLGEGTRLGEWEMATEDPSGLYRKIGKSKYAPFFDENGVPYDENADAYYKLDEKGRSTYARYNPYMHSSNLMLNDQFAGAYEYSDENSVLGKFVTVKCIVPNSEIESGYRARYSKDPVGWTNWKAGGVAQELAEQGGERRNVFLSRWIKPLEIVDDSEVAQHYRKLLEGKDISVPANVVTPSLREELEKAGVKIGPPQKQAKAKFERTTGLRYSLDLDDVLSDMTADEFGYESGLFGTDEALNVQTNDVADIRNEFDPTIYNGRLYVKPETLEAWLSPSGFASTNPQYAQAYIATMNPRDFLRMTTASEAGQQWLLNATQPLNANGNNIGDSAGNVPIQLLVDESTWKVEGHEGRHRSIALSRAGVTEMPVLLFDMSTKYSKTPHASIQLTGQDSNGITNGNTLTLTDVIPLNLEHADEIRGKYLASEAERNAAADNGQNVLEYSLDLEEARDNLMAMQDTEPADLRDVGPDVGEQTVESDEVQHYIGTGDESYAVNGRANMEAFEDELMDSWIQNPNGRRYTMQDRTQPTRQMSQYNPGQQGGQNTNPGAPRQQGGNNRGRRDTNSPQRIVKNLAKALGVGATIGTRYMNGAGTNVAGWYMPRFESLAVRNRHAGNYVTGMHEIGHAISERLGNMMGSPEMVQRLFVDQFRHEEFSPEAYLQDQLRNPSVLPQEAFAEFMWRYMEDENLARQFSGDQWYNDFEKGLRDHGLYDLVHNAAEEIRAWRTMEVADRIGTSIVSRSETQRDSIVDRFRRLIDGLIDATHAAERINHMVREQSGQTRLPLQQDLRQMSRLVNFAGRRAEGVLNKRLTDPIGRQIGDSLAKRFRDAGFAGTQADIDLLEEYMLAQHSIDRDAEGKPVFDRHITEQERLAFIQNIQNTRQDIVNAEQAFQDFRKEFLKAWLVDTGFLTQHQFDEMNNTYPHYVPTFRVKDERFNSMNRMNSRHYTMREATGSTEDIWSPIDSWCEMVNSIVNMVLQNEAAKTFEYVWRNYEGMGIFAKEVTGDVMRMTQDLDNDFFVNATYSVGTTIPNGIVVRHTDGTFTAFEVLDTELYKLLAGAHETSNNPIWETVAKLTRGMAMLTTGNNPVFAVRNAMRDFQTSVNYGTWAATYGDGLYKWLRGFWEVWQRGGVVEDYEAIGGGGWTRVETRTRKGANELKGELFQGYGSENKLKQAGNKIWSAITLSRLNEIVEQTSRYVEYAYGKHDLTTPEGRQEAFLAAQDVTVDFARKGNGAAASALKQLIPFFGASTQGVARTARQFTESEHGKTDDGAVVNDAARRFIKTVFNTGLLSVILSALIHAFSDDDDKKAFMEMSSGLKATHFYLPNFAPDVLGLNPFVRIPVGQDPLMYAVHGLITNAMWSGRDDGPAIAFAEIGQAVLDNLNPFGNGTIFEPLLSVARNKTYYGGNIIPASQTSYADPSLQYSDNTPDVFIGLGRVFGVSPNVVQYLAEQYTGFLGQLTIPMLSKTEGGHLGGWQALRDAVQKKFTSDPLTNTDVLDDFYDGKNWLSTIKSVYEAGKPLNMLRHNLTDIEAEDAYDEAKKLVSASGTVGKASKEINGLYNQIREIQANDKLGAREKREKVDELRREIIRIALEAQEAIAEYRDKYFTGYNMVLDVWFPGWHNYN